MRPFDGRRVLLGVTGGIASYKAAWLARLLSQAGAEVDVVMTRAATEFITPLTFEALTGRAVYTDIFRQGGALDHIRLAQQAHAIVVAPATADFLARAAHGMAGDLLSAILLATEAPVVLVPAMNDKMWAHPQTRQNVAHLRELGYAVVDPDDGPLAAGEGSGPGRMPEPESILAHAGRALEQKSLAGRTVLVTAGATREAADPVRFLSNRSSGKMGVALAAAAWRRGATVRLVAGPIEVAPPVGPTVVRVETADEMARAVATALPSSDVLLMAAAPADYKVAEPASSKMKRTRDARALELEPTSDILATTKKRRRNGAVIVGFALETENLEKGARAKLDSKGLDLVVANAAGEPDSGFSVDTNRAVLLGRDGTSVRLPLMQKTELADVILDRVEGLLGER
ncbi:MAG TPA: bifunctional phosphopantothenoylcysteine decarboxylase/phosphopantothenate--cysteine ligase CoaBC [Gemmatimonadaceae bacterium]|nr:bifunctional phosphopantothenoylcysteine decarboxylase/phosphopantothenate--cysteine ligase CoaBC [Gemmatimonadaceae bacterium]